jgi:hypothetical protein
MDQKEAFTGPEQGEDFGVGVEPHSKPPPIPSRDSFLQWFKGIETGIVVMLGMAHGVPQSLQQVVRGDYIGVSQTQVDNVPAFLAHFGKARIHFRTQIAFK